MRGGGLGPSSPVVFPTPLDSSGLVTWGMSHRPAAPELDPTKGQRAGLARGRSCWPGGKPSSLTWLRGAGTSHPEAPLNL